MGEPKTPEDHRVIAFKLMRKCGVAQDVVEQIVVHMSEACHLAKIEGKEEAIVEVMYRVSMRAKMAEVCHAGN